MKKYYLSVLVLLCLSSQAFSVTTLTVTDMTERRVYQRYIGGSTGYASVTFTYTGTPTPIDARVVAHGTSTVIKDWTTLGTPSSSPATFKLDAIPQGGWYNIQIRDHDNQGTTSNGSARWGIGDLYVDGGQSNGGCFAVAEAYCTACSDTTPDDLLSIYTAGGGWASPAGCDGSITFAQKIIDAENIPVGIIYTPVGASGMLASYAVIGYWLEDNGTAGTHYNTMKSIVNGAAVKDASDATGRIKAYIGFHGENEGHQGCPRNTYSAAWGSMLTDLRADFNDDLVVIIAGLGRYAMTDGHDHDAVWNAVVLGQYDAAENSGIYLGASSMDASLGSSDIHRDATGNVTVGQRLGQTALFLDGLQAYYRGPYILGLKRIDSTHIDVYIKHRGGSDFTPSSGITGFSVLNDGSAVSVSAAARQNYQTIRLTTAETTWGTTVTVRYQYGTHPTVTSPVYDNTAMALPLETGTTTTEMDAPTSSNTSSGISGSGIGMQ